MKLYYTPGACSLVVHIVLNELGLTPEYEAVDLKTKKTEKNQNFLSINPKGAVPTLVTDDQLRLTENAVILQYLADAQQAYQLLPRVGDFKRYQVLEWLNYCATELHKGFSPLFNPSMPPDVKGNILIPQLEKKLAFINEHLSKNTYLMGDEFTLPDAYLFVMLRWADAFKLQYGEHVQRYFTELKNRAAIKKSLQDEGLQ